MAPRQPYDDSTLAQREPAVVIITATLILVNALLGVVFAFVSLDPGQVAALYGVVNPAAGLAAAIVTRGRVAPWQPIEVPIHATDEGYDPDAAARANGF